MTLKDQLEQEIQKRHMYLCHASRDSNDMPGRRSKPNTSLATSVGLARKSDVEALLLDHQAQKIVDDLVEPQPSIGRAMSPIRAAFTRSRSPFRGHRALPHSPVPLRSAVRQ